MYVENNTNILVMDAFRLLNICIIAGSALVAVFGLLNAFGCYLFVISLPVFRWTMKLFHGHQKKTKRQKSAGAKISILAEGRVGRKYSIIVEKIVLV